MLPTEILSTPVFETDLTFLRVIFPDVLSGALLYFRKRDKTPLESKLFHLKERRTTVKEDIQPETKEVLTANG